MKTDKPADELQDFAVRTAKRLRRTHSLQITMAISIFVFMGLIAVWSFVMVSIGRLTYATGFGTSSIGGLALTQWKWQPFERAAQAARHADALDVLALGLRSRLKTIEKIKDPDKRQRLQWEATRDFTYELGDWNKKN